MTACCVFIALKKYFSYVYQHDKVTYSKVIWVPSHVFTLFPLVLLTILKISPKTIEL